MFGNTERRTQHWDKLVDPPGEAKEDAWQIIEVARRMGMGDLFPWATEEERGWHEPMFEEYRRFTLGTARTWPATTSSGKERGLRWPVVDGKETRYRYAAGHDPYVEKKAKGVHFYKAKKFGEKAAFWLRPYHPPAEVTRRGVPALALHGPRSRALAHGLDDAPRARAAPGHARGLRGGQPRRRHGARHPKPASIVRVFEPAR